MRALNRKLSFIVFVVLLPVPLAGQITEGSLSKEFGKPVADTFQVAPGITMKAVYGPSGDVCVLTVTGKSTESQIQAIFDIAVPSAFRGATKQELTQCTGPCMRSSSFEYVSLSSGTVWRQTATPAAIITFHRAECRPSVEEADKVMTYIERH